jgi:hypothetical protein
VQRAIALARLDRHAEALVAMDKVDLSSLASIDTALRITMLYEQTWCLRETDRTDEAIGIYDRLLAEQHITISRQRRHWNCRSFTLRRAGASKRSLCSNRSPSRQPFRRVKLACASGHCFCWLHAILNSAGSRNARRQRHSSPANFPNPNQSHQRICWQENRCSGWAGMVRPLITFA